MYVYIYIYIYIYTLATESHLKDANMYPWSIQSVGSFFGIVCRQRSERAHG